MQEIWKEMPVDGYKNYYSISNLGNVKRTRRHVWFGGITCDEYPIKQRIGRSGYMTAILSVLDKKKYVYVHRMVALAFIPNPNNLPQVNHIDGNKLNNRVDNLEWCTLEYNVIHAHKNHLIPKPKTRKIYQFDLYGNKIKSWKSISYASEKTGICLTCIYKACQKQAPQAGGYIWSYSPKINISDEIYKKLKQKRYQKYFL